MGVRGGSSEGEGEENGKKEGEGTPKGRSRRAKEREKGMPPFHGTSQYTYTPHTSINYPHIHKPLLITVHPITIKAKEGNRRFGNLLLRKATERASKID